MTISHLVLSPGHGKQKMLSEDAGTVLVFLIAFSYSLGSLLEDLKLLRGTIVDSTSETCFATLPVPA